MVLLCNNKKELKGEKLQVLVFQLNAGNNKKELKGLIGLNEEQRQQLK